MKRVLLYAVTFCLMVCIVAGAQTNVGPLKINNGAVINSSNDVARTNAANSFSAVQSFPFGIKMVNTSSGNFVQNIYFEQGLNPSSAVTANQFGLGLELFTYASNAQNFGGAQQAIYGSFSKYGAGTLSSGIGGAFESFNDGSGAATVLAGVTGTVNCGGPDAGDPVQHGTNNGDCLNLRAFDGVYKSLGTGNVSNGVVFYAEGPQVSLGHNFANAWGMLIQDQAGAGAGPANTWAIQTLGGKVEHQGPEIVHGTLTPMGGIAGTSLEIQPGRTYFATGASTTLGNTLSGSGGTSASYNSAVLWSNSKGLSAGDGLVQANVALPSWGMCLGGGSSEFCNDGFTISRVGAGGNFAGRANLFSLDAAGTTTIAGQLISNGLKISGSINLPAATTGNAYFAGGLGGAIMGTLFLGDGSGWEYDFAKRTASVTTNTHRFFDNGNLDITGQYKVNGSQIAASNLSNGVQGSGAVVLASSATITSATFSGLQTYSSQTLGIGNGASNNLTALAKGTGSGPASLATVQWRQITVNGSTYWTPLFQ